MSSHEIKLENAYQKMIEQNIKSQLEKNGTMAALRSEMHVKILQMMRGQQKMSKVQPLTGGASGGSNHSEDHSLVKLINHMVMEFLDWFGYKHTLETLRMETGESVANRREMEQSLLIIPESKDIPLLAQLVMRDWKFGMQKEAPKKLVQLPDPMKATPQRSRKLVQELKVMRAQKSEVNQDRLVQNNRKLITNNTFTKGLTPKSISTPPRSIKNENAKSYVDSSESDVLESDYSEEESEDSDAYKDIPDRQIFIDDLPPEGKYAPNHGEEGPFRGKQDQADERDNIPSSSRKQHFSRKPQTESSDSDDKPLNSGRQDYWNSPREVQLRSQNTSKSAGECDTHIRKVNLDSDCSSDED